MFVNNAFGKRETCLLYSLEMQAFTVSGQLFLFLPSFWGKKDACKRCDMFWQKLCFNVMQPIGPCVLCAQQMSSNLNCINRAVASVFLWNRSFWSKCWVHSSFIAETVKSSFPTFLESVSSTHSHGLFLWGVSFCWESFSLQKGERKGAPTVVQACIPRASYRQLFPSSNSLSLSLSPSIYICIYIYFFLIEQLFQHFAPCWCGWWCLPSLLQFLMFPPFLLIEVLSLTSYCIYPIP